MPWSPAYVFTPIWEVIPSSKSPKDLAEKIWGNLHQNSGKRPKPGPFIVLPSVVPQVGKTLQDILLGRETEACLADLLKTPAIGQLWNQPDRVLTAPGLDFLLTNQLFTNYANLGAGCALHPHDTSFSHLGGIEKQFTTVVITEAHERDKAYKGERPATIALRQTLMGEKLMLNLFSCCSFY